MTRRVMAYGDSNTWGYEAHHGAEFGTRYGTDTRWPCAMAAALGDAELVEEGLNGRTTDIADPTHPEVGGAGLDGAAYLPAALASHLPLDLVVIMLGTNDLKAMFVRSPLRIALGAGRLIDIARRIGGGIGTGYASPAVLLVCPPPLGVLTGEFPAMFAGGVETSRQLAPAYAAVAQAAGVPWLDAGTVIASDGADGLHFSAAAQRALGHAIAERIRAP